MGYINPANQMLNLARQYHKETKLAWIACHITRYLGLYMDVGRCRLKCHAQILTTPEWQINHCLSAL
jgi:hypothetical protein